MKIKLVKFTTGEYGIQKECLLSSKWYDFTEGEFASTMTAQWNCCRRDESIARKHFDLLTSKHEVVEAR